MATTLIIPGLHNSGPDHWQSWFEAHVPGSVRVIQRDWKDPNLPDWASRVRREINRIPGKLFIAAHSFGVLAAVQAASDFSDRIGGALLVAPADPDRFGIADYLPQTSLPFPSVIVGSTNDPWMRHDRVAHWADVWGSDFVSLGDAGHINAESGYGAWPEGLALLLRLRRQHAAQLDAVAPLRVTPAARSLRQLQVGSALRPTRVAAAS